MILIENLKFLKGPKDKHFRKGLFHGFRPNIEFSLTAVFCRNNVREDHISIFWKGNDDF